jgi:uncharacterized protein VirK/YbjX
MERVSDYYTRGWRLGRDPNPDFSVSDYLSDHPDVRAVGMEPLEHYLTYGRAEGRRVKASRYKDVVRMLAAWPEFVALFDSDHYQRQVGPTLSGPAPLVDYMTTGWRSGADPYPGFDAAFYTLHNGVTPCDVVSPFEHYVTIGRRLGYAVNPKDAFKRVVSDSNPTRSASLSAILDQVLSIQPDFLAGWRSGKYLCTNFSAKDRWSSFLFHYEFIFSRLTDECFAELLLNARRLWRYEIMNRFYEVKLSYARTNGSYLEGELSLDLLADGVRIYTLSFSVLPGDRVGSAAAPVLFISRLQGVKHHREAIVLASRDCHDIAPEHLLFTCLQGVAMALGVEGICGISAEIQPSRSNADLPRLESRYDRFFESLGMVRTAAGTYVRTVSEVERPLAAIKASHRRRTRIKRQRKREIAEACQDALIGGLSAAAWPAERAA